jgi:hypothetical protein
MRRLTLALALLAACQSPAVPELRLDRAGAPIAPADFPGAAALLQGFDPVSAASPEWRAGDEVLFGLRLRVGERLRHWLLHLRVTEPLALARAGDEAEPDGLQPPLSWTLNVNDAPQRFDSRRARVLLTVCDAFGQVLARSEPELPRDLLARGFAAACELVQARQRSQPQSIGTDAFYQDLDLQPLAEATVCAVALLQVVQEDKVLAPLLWEVIERPSVWSVLSNLGARVVLRPRFHAAVEVPIHAAGQPAQAWRVPMTLLVNDAAVLSTELVVADAAPPFALAGGILGATARHPADAGREFALQLLAARRGPDQRSVASGRDIALDRR